MERRSEPRFPLETPDQGRLRLPSEEEVDATVFELSNVGAFIAIDRDVPPQTRVHFSMLTDSGERIWMEAIVARRADSVETSRGPRPAGFGIVLLAETRIQREFLQETVMKHLAVEASRLAS